MKRLFNRIMERRAALLAEKVRPHLPESGSVLDVGSGTGHNARAMRLVSNMDFHEADVVDMSVVGDGPLIFDGKKLPYSDDRFSCSMLLFVLQYVPNPSELLDEVKRISNSRVIILQTVYRNPFGCGLLWFQELFTGRLSFQLARIFRCIPAVNCMLSPRTLYSRAELKSLVESSGLEVVSVESISKPSLFLSHELYIVEKSNSHINSKSAGAEDTALNHEKAP